MNLRHAAFLLASDLADSLLRADVCVCRRFSEAGLFQRYAWHYTVMYYLAQQCIFGFGIADCWVCLPLDLLFFLYHGRTNQP